MPVTSPSARRHALAAGALGAALIATAAVSQTAPAPPPPITRTGLLRQDLSAAGREAIQVRVDFAPAATAPRHRHPGEELVYVLSGALEYRLDGRPPVTLRAGDVLFIPADAIHAVTNVGSDRGSELATYIVEKGRPLVELVP